jgi:hypothetical protein
MSEQRTRRRVKRTHWTGWSPRGQHKRETVTLWVCIIATAVALAWWLPRMNREKPVLEPLGYEESSPPIFGR